MRKQISVHPLRLPTSLKAAVAGISAADGTSINQFVTTAVAEKVSAMKTAEFFTGARPGLTSRRRGGCCEEKVASLRNSTPAHIDGACRPAPVPLSVGWASMAAAAACPAPACGG